MSVGTIEDGPYRTDVEHLDPLGSVPHAPQRLGVDDRREIEEGPRE
jgi:hypothetical protein